MTGIIKCLTKRRIILFDPNFEIAQVLNKTWEFVSQIRCAQGIKTGQKWFTECGTEKYFFYGTVEQRNTSFTIMRDAMLGRICF